MPPLIVNTQEIRKFVGLNAGPGESSVAGTIAGRPSRCLSVDAPSEFCSVITKAWRPPVCGRVVIVGWYRDGAAAVCHVGSAAGMLLIRGALAAQVWIHRRTKGRCAGARTLSVTASEITNEEYETAWARRRRSLLKRIRCASAGDPAASAEDPWGTGPLRSRASAADEPRKGARRRSHPRPPGYPTPDARSRTGT